MRKANKRLAGSKVAIAIIHTETAQRVCGRLNQFRESSARLAKRSVLENELFSLWQQRVENTRLRL
jgi:hypothetical protein